MGEVVHGVGIPLVASADVGDVEYTIDEWVAEQHVGVSHVDLGTQYECAWFALTAIHELEQLEVFLNGTIAVWAVGTWASGGTLLLGNNLGALFVDISASLLDEPYGKVPELLEVVAGIVDIGPLKAQPLDIVLDALDVFCVLLDGVCIVEAQVALTAVLLC